MPTWKERLLCWRQGVVRRHPVPVTPTCCAMAGLLVEWMDADSRGPTDTGWACAYDNVHFVNVIYCPFCGVELKRV